MARPPADARDRSGTIRLDAHWRRSIVFTLVLVGLVAASVGTEWSLALVLVGSSAVGFGFFYLVFPGGAHFGMTVANFLAIYACLFEFFHEANFPDAPRPATLASLFLPVIGFLAVCLLRRRQVITLIRSRRVRRLDQLPKLARWLIATMAVGAASFILPSLDLGPAAQGHALLAAMGLITVFVMLAMRDVILVMADVAIVFETVAARLDRLIMPMLAFLTFYGLLVVVFACLYRIADLTMPGPQFTLHAEPMRIRFVESLYYSVATITTLGYGDISPASLLVRALSGLEVVCGVLMLLFGFSEIMRGAGPDSQGHDLPPGRTDPRDSP